MRQLLDQVFLFFPNSIFSANFFSCLGKLFTKPKTKKKKQTGVASPHLIKLEGVFPARRTVAPKRCEKSTITNQGRRGKLRKMNAKQTATVAGNQQN